MALHTMIQRFRNAKALVDETGRQAATEIAQGLGALLPTGFILEWAQYTDYFNDGEACTFSVHSVYLATAGDPERPFGIRSNSTGVMDLEYDRNLGDVSGDVRDALRDSFNTLPHELLERAFGDHVRVRVYPDGSFKTESYINHD